MTPAPHPLRYRKKPIEVEAYQLTEEKEIHTREGIVKGFPGDWIITGIQGEIYPCGKKIFELTYEPVGCASHSSAKSADKVLDEFQVCYYCDRDHCIAKKPHGIPNGCGIRCEDCLCDVCKSAGKKQAGEQE